MSIINGQSCVTKNVTFCQSPIVSMSKKKTPSVSQIVTSKGHDSLCITELKRSLMASLQSAQTIAIFNQAAKTSLDMVVGCIEYHDATLIQRAYRQLLFELINEIERRWPLTKVFSASDLEGYTRHLMEIPTPSVKEMTYSGNLNKKHFCQLDNGTYQYVLFNRSSHGGADLGSGAASRVRSGVRESRGNTLDVAIKKQPIHYLNYLDTYKEYIITKKFEGHPNIIKVDPPMINIQNTKGKVPKKPIVVPIEKGHVVCVTTIPLSDRFKAMIDMSKALSDMHENGWVHGDFKKENIVKGSNNQYKLIDYGFAIPLDATYIQGSGGTLYSPQAISNQFTRQYFRDVTKIDAWALGVEIVALLFNARYPCYFNRSKQAYYYQSAAQKQTMFDSYYRHVSNILNAVSSTWMGLSVSDTQELKAIIHGLLAPSEGDRLSVSQANIRLNSIMTKNNSGPLNTLRTKTTISY
ncbi:MAG: protein kinase domain-containing protein [Candidatus Marinamargulisbacteria bacterium]